MYPTTVIDDALGAIMPSQFGHPPSSSMNSIQTYPLSLAQDLIEMAGLEIVADQIGTWPTVILTTVVVFTIAISIIGGRRAWQQAKSASKGEIASRLRDQIEEESDDGEVVQMVNEEDNDILTEATQRLERRGEDITGENLSAALEEIEQEQKADKNELTGLLNEPGDRAPTAKMSVSPDKIEEHEDYLLVKSTEGGERYIRSMMISSHPDRVGYGWLDKFFSSGLQTTGADIRVSYHILPRDPDTMMSKLDQRASRLTSTIRRKEREGKIDTMEEKQQREKVNQLRDRLSKGSTKLFDFALYLQVIADDEERLADATEEVKQTLATANARVTPITDRQLDAFRSTAPLGKDFIKQTQIMDLQSLGTTFPFIEPTRIEPSGVLVGFHQTTSSPVIVDRFKLSGHNMLVTGKIGSGKSYLTKLMLWRRLMMDPESELLIIDPVGGFGDMVEGLQGQRIKIDRNTIINPLEITEATSSEGELETDPYDMKIRSVMGMFKTHFEGKTRLTKGQEGLLRRAIRYAYLEKGITKSPRTHSNESPTIQDVIDILRNFSKGKDPANFLDVDEELRQHIGTAEEEDRQRTEAMRQSRNREAEFAHDVLLGLEEFTAGGQRAFLNGKTNIDMHNRVVQFDLDNVADDNNSDLLMHIVLDFLFQRAKGSDTRTLVGIDEAHYLLDSEGALSALNTFTRHSRHYNAGLTLISQTVDEFMGGQEKEIYDQCDIRVLMNHEDIGDEAMKALGLTPPERDFVLRAQAGNSSDHSEALVYTADAGKRRVQVYSYPYEHHIIDKDAPSAWSFLWDKGDIRWKDIPEEKRDIVRREAERQAGPEPASAD